MRGCRALGCHSSASSLECFPEPAAGIVDVAVARLLRLISTEHKSRAVLLRMPPADDMLNNRDAAGADEIARDLQSFSRQSYGLLVPDAYVRASTPLKSMALPRLR